MESTDQGMDRARAADMLASVDDVQHDVARDVRTPRGYDEVAGTAAGLNVAAFGLVLGADRGWHLAVGAALFVVAGAGLWWAVRRFRTVNGVWISGVRGGTTARPMMIGTAVMGLLIGITAGGAAIGGWWWLGLVLAPIEVVTFIVVSRRWMTLYRAELGGA